MAHGLIFRTVLVGDVAGSIDNRDGDTLSDNDVMLTVESGEFHVHYVDEDSGLSQNTPKVITPASNPGDKRAILCDMVVQDLKYYGNVQPMSSVQSIVGDGEISAVPLTEFSATGINTLTIVSGEYVGQRKSICMISGEAEDHAGILSGEFFAGTSLVFGHDGDAVDILYTSDGKWHCMHSALYTP